jgi:hypothetical protein
LNPNKRQTYGLIGPAVENPAISGGGSADLTPHYVSRPLEAIIDVVGSENVKAAIGCQGKYHYNTSVNSQLTESSPPLYSSVVEGHFRTQQPRARIPCLLVQGRPHT